MKSSERMNDYTYRFNEYTISIVLSDYSLVNAEAVESNPYILEFAKDNFLKRLQSHVANMTTDDLYVTAPLTYGDEIND
jgi:hypothetical protein